MPVDGPPKLTDPAPEMTLPRTKLPAEPLATASELVTEKVAPMPTEMPPPPSEAVAVVVLEFKSVSVPPLIVVPLE